MSDWRQFRGWKIVRAGSIVQTVMSAVFLQQYGNFTVGIKSEFNWSASLFSLAFSANRLESGLLGPVHGWALERFGIRRVMQFGAVLMAIGLVLLSRLNSPVTFFVFYLITSIGASLAGFLTIVTATVRWFDVRRSKALSISQAGFAIGGLCTPVIVFFIGSIGWRNTFLMTAVVVLVVVLPVSRTFVDWPADVGEYVEGVDPAEAAAQAEAKHVASGGTGPAPVAVAQISFTAGEAMRTKAFWYISLGHMCALLVVGGVLAHLAPYLVEERGFSAQRASFVGAALPFIQLVGQLVGGVLGDRYSKRLISCLAMFGHVAGLLVLARANSEWMVWLFVPLHGVAWGLRGPLMQAWRADYFGAAAFGKIMGYSSMIIMFGQMGGPLVVGFTRDATNSYTPGFVAVAIMASVGTLFFALASPPQPPKRPAPTPVTV